MSIKRLCKLYRKDYGYDEWGDGVMVGLYELTDEEINQANELFEEAKLKSLKSGIYQVVHTLYRVKIESFESLKSHFIEQEPDEA